MLVDETLVEALTELCDEIDKHEIHAAISKTSILWFKRKALAALQSQAREAAFCVWHNDPETDNSWDTGCSQLFELYDGSPSENHMSFCCYCGKPIQEASHDNQ